MSLTSASDKSLSIQFNQLFSVIFLFTHQLFSNSIEYISEPNFPRLSDILE